MRSRPPIDESGPPPVFNSKPGNFQEMEEFGPNARYWRWNMEQYLRNAGCDCGPTAVACAVNMTIWSRGSSETVNVGDAIHECAANGAYVEGDMTHSTPKLGEAITALTGMSVTYQTDFAGDSRPPLSWQQALALGRTRWLIVNKPGHISAAVADRNGAECLWLMQGRIGGGFDGEDGDGKITEATWHHWRRQTLHPNEPLWLAPGVQEPAPPVRPSGQSPEPAPPPLATSLRSRRLWGQQAVWLWDLRHFSQSAATIADRIASQGYDAVYMKASDGGRRWTHQWNRATIQHFLDRGLKVAGWHYLYGYHDQSEGPATEANAVLWAANVYPEIPHILDIEYEYLPSHQQRPGAAGAFFDALGVHERLDGLAYCPDLRIAFRNQWPRRRETYPDGGGFPWAEFNQRCAAIFPMNYFHTFELSPQEGSFNLIDAWRRGFPGAPPIYPIYDQGPHLQEALDLGWLHEFPTQSVWAFRLNQAPLSRPPRQAEPVQPSRLTMRQPSTMVARIATPAAQPALSDSRLADDVATILERAADEARHRLRTAIEAAATVTTDANGVAATSGDVSMARHANGEASPTADSVLLRK